MALSATLQTSSPVLSASWPYPLSSGLPTDEKLLLVCTLLSTPLWSHLRPFITLTPPYLHHPRSLSHLPALASLGPRNRSRRARNIPRPIPFYPPSSTRHNRRFSSPGFNTPRSTVCNTRWRSRCYLLGTPWKCHRQHTNRRGWNTKLSYRMSHFSLSSLPSHSHPAAHTAILFLYPSFLCRNNLHFP